MKKSEKILQGNNISGDLPKWKQEIIKNTTLLEHLINNEMPHLWRWMYILIALILGLYARSLF